MSDLRQRVADAIDECIFESKKGVASRDAVADAVIAVCMSEAAKVAEGFKPEPDNSAGGYWTKDKAKRAQQALDIATAIRNLNNVD